LQRGQLLHQIWPEKVLLSPKQKDSNETNINKSQHWWQHWHYTLPLMNLYFIVPLHDIAHWGEIMCAAFDIVQHPRRCVQCQQPCALMGGAVCSIATTNFPCILSGLLTLCDIHIALTTGAICGIGHHLPKLFPVIIEGRALLCIPRHRVAGTQNIIVVCQWLPEVVWGWKMLMPNWFFRWPHQKKINMRRWHWYCYLLSIDVCARFKLCGQNDKPGAIGQGGNKQKIYNNQPTGGAAKKTKKNQDVPNIIGSWVGKCYLLIAM